MKSTPLVSVIIPTYNRQKLVRRAINSVLSQTVQDFEIIVVDDGSTDNSQFALNSYGDERIRILKHKENLGSPSARNTGFSEAVGQYIAFLDSDDEWHPTKLERQLELFEVSDVNNLGAVNCGLIVKNGSVRGQQYWRPSARGQVFWTLLGLKEYHDTASMWLIKKEYLDAMEGPFDTRLLYVQVSDLLVRLSRLCQIDFVPEPLVTYYDHDLPPRNVMYPLDIQGDAYTVYIEKHEKDLQRRPKIYSHILTTFGTRFLKGGLRKESRTYYQKAIKLEPSNLRAWMLWAVSFTGGRGYDLARKVRYQLTNGRLYQHELIHDKQILEGNPPTEMCSKAR